MTPPLVLTEITLVSKLLLMVHTSCTTLKSIDF